MTLNDTGHECDTVDNAGSGLSVKEIAAHCKTYKGADTKHAILQLTTTMALFIATCALMVYSLNISYWITALLILPAGGLLVRLFIFQHDCGHGSFFKTKKANDWVGRFLSVFTFTPYDFWRRAHNKHHATSGDLDRRSIGGIDTITVREYQALSKGQQLAYRIYRHPIVLLVIGTPIYVIIAQRIPFTQGTPFHDNYNTLPVRSIWKSIMLTNVGILAFYGGLSYLIGLGAVMAVYLPILLVTAWVGGWMFYVQHQFEETYWQRHKDFNLNEAALMGSSYYELPKIFQWFSGNIGIHHIHHLSSAIPNYKLQECLDAEPSLKKIGKLTFRDSLKCINLKLWDEDKNQMVGISRATQ
jgi:omega-6 fatty acid desaturase (delta-12 desaturase)